MEGDWSFDARPRSVRVDHAVRRGMVRATRSIGWGQNLVAALAVISLLPLMLGFLLPGMPWPARFVIALVVVPVGLLGFAALRLREAARSCAPVGSVLTAQLTAHELRVGLDGAAAPTGWSELGGVREVRGHLVLVPRRSDAARICLPPALLDPGDVDRARAHVLFALRGRTTPGGVVPGHALQQGDGLPAPATEEADGSVVVDAHTADRVAADAARLVDARRRWVLLGALAFVALCPPLFGLPQVAGVFSVAFVLVVGARWLGPVVTRRRIRNELLPPGQEPYRIRVVLTPDGYDLVSGEQRASFDWAEHRTIRRSGSAVVLVALDGGRLVLPTDAFAPGAVEQAGAILRSLRR